MPCSAGAWLAVKAPASYNNDTLQQGNGEWYLQYAATNNTFNWQVRSCGANATNASTAGSTAGPEDDRIVHWVEYALGSLHKGGGCPTSTEDHSRTLGGVGKSISKPARLVVTPSTR